MKPIGNSVNERLPAVPLITCDPYFSVWSPADTLYGEDTMNWTGYKKPIHGFVTIDGVNLRFLGKRQPGDIAIKQTGLAITPTASLYTFATDAVRFTVSFRTPLLMDDLDVMSRPCSYIDFEAESLDGKSHNVEIYLRFEKNHCYHGDAVPAMIGGKINTALTSMVWMGQAKQTPAGHSGDVITIDWGYLYLAAPARYGASFICEIGAGRQTGIACAVKMEIKPDVKANSFIVAAYDDITSLYYFGRFQPGYWARNGMTIVEAIDAAISEHDKLNSRCDAFDDKLCGMAGVFGKDYTRLCCAAYRQSIAAHKLIADEKGQVIFISKECQSNGCAGTVDVTYPSTPLYFLLNPELVRGMLRPVLRFAKLPAWEYDFAPHDVGRFPYVNGQVYGIDRNNPNISRAAFDLSPGGVHPMYYTFPAGSALYDLAYQMPVEECGNMLILAAALIKLGDKRDVNFAAENMELYEKWVKYLEKYGADPGNQLCTDDFAGHLAHNVNLAVKAVAAIACYSIILESIGRKTEADDYMKKAKDMASDLYVRAGAGDHTRLTLTTLAVGVSNIMRYGI